MALHELPLLVSIFKLLGSEEKKLRIMIEKFNFANTDNSQAYKAHSRLRLNTLLVRK